VHRVVIKEVQHGLFAGEVLHADFRVVAETDIIEMSVAVGVHGEAPGLTEGGVLEQNSSPWSWPACPRICRTRSPSTSPA